MQLGRVSIDITADTAAAGALEAAMLGDEIDLLVNAANSDDSEARGLPTFATPETTTVATMEAVRNLPAPRQCRSTSSHLSARSSCNKSSFPAQANNLLGWLQPVATHPSAPCILLQLAEQRSLSTVLSNHPTRLSVPCTPPNRTTSPRAVSRAGSSTLEPCESTAIKLAKQL
jgi:hypothetical protein